MRPSALPRLANISPNAPSRVPLRWRAETSMRTEAGKTSGFTGPRRHGAPVAMFSTT